MAVDKYFDDYFKLKEKYPDQIVMMRNGSFYDIIGDDALAASRMLDKRVSAVSDGKRSLHAVTIPYHELHRATGALAASGYGVIVEEPDNE